MTPFGNIDLCQYWPMLRLCAALVKYRFLDSMAINQVHSPVKLHTVVLETHSAADGTQPGKVTSNCKIKAESRHMGMISARWTGKHISILHVYFCSSSQSPWNVWTNLIHPNKTCCGKFVTNVLVAYHICEKPTTSEAQSCRHFQNTAGNGARLCTKLPGCVEGRDWSDKLANAWIYVEYDYNTFHASNKNHPIYLFIDSDVDNPINVILISILGGFRGNGYFTVQLSYPRYSLGWPLADESTTVRVLRADYHITMTS